MQSINTALLSKRIEQQDELIRTQQVKIDEVLKYLQNDKARQDEYDREKRKNQIKVSSTFFIHLVISIFVTRKTKKTNLSR